MIKGVDVKATFKNINDLQDIIQNMLNVINEYEYPITDAQVKYWYNKEVDEHFIEIYLPNAEYKTKEE